MKKFLLPRSVLRRMTNSLALAGTIGALAMTGISTASAQATSGMVFGKAPAGYSIAVRSDTTGGGRSVKVDSTGRYSARELVPGTYTVTLKRGDQAVAKHLDVTVTVGRGIEVDFSCSEIKCDEVANTR